jgi:hypothetical protein
VRVADGFCGLRMQSRASTCSCSKLGPCLSQVQWQACSARCSCESSTLAFAPVRCLAVELATSRIIVQRSELWVHWGLGELLGSALVSVGTVVSASVTVVVTVAPTVVVALVVVTSLVAARALVSFTAALAHRAVSAVAAIRGAVL